ncbi:MAG: SAP domain-containing protein [bacterium]
MNMSKVKARAENIGIKPGRMKKDEIIKQIQRKEGNFDCFRTATSGECDQINCCWRDDCLK